jgi:hypothetical protein
MRLQETRDLQVLECERLYFMLYCLSARTHLLLLRYLANTPQLVLNWNESILHLKMLKKHTYIKM